MKKENNLVGRWLKALVNNPTGGCVLAGEYGLITKHKNNTLEADFYSQKYYSCFDALDSAKGFYQLMPEGFDPNKTINKYYFY